ncbi:DUF1629 domain-containing protein [uncultured Lacinutrix sp.]|uniref:imm11 family protein n=1 Tax=uncultured Lacinutrix sp. TaxID=574032 RepID=UPI00261A7812|nr:DUF1629 domain-containing protein [uncultured Lacinutrix sp.]
MYYELYEKYKRSLYFFFDESKSEISWLNFFKGVSIDSPKILYYNVDIIDSYIVEYDFLPVSSGPPLVSEKFRNTFIELENEQLQFIPAKIIDKEGNINDMFYSLNILNLIECLDKKKSVFKINSYESYEIKKLYIDSKLIKNNLDIIRLKEDELRIIINENFKKKSEIAKLKGMSFVEEGYSIYTNL